jgi:hypothetical protein
MPAHEDAAAAKRVSAKRTPAERVAVRRLEAALAEQARVRDLYARSLGTSAEQSAHARLQAASLKVSECDRLTTTV